MLTKSELQERYRRIERQVDEIGRTIGVRRLRLSEQLHIEEMAPNSPGGVALIAASVCELDGAPLPMVRDRQELDHQLDLLDVEGMRAATKAWAKIMGLADESQKGDSQKSEVEGEIDRAKK